MCMISLCSQTFSQVCVISNELNFIDLGKSSGDEEKHPKEEWVKVFNISIVISMFEAICRTQYQIDSYYPLKSVYII